MIALAVTAHGTYAVDVETDELVGPSDEEVATHDPSTGLPRVVAADAVGATVVALVDARPPLLVSYDAGATWRDAGGGLPTGRDVAIHPDNPDVVLYGARNRLFLSRDGGRFWSALSPELPEIERVAWARLT